jgi:hypothetical protein
MGSIVFLLWMHSNVSLYLDSGLFVPPGSVTVRFSIPHLAPADSPQARGLAVFLVEMSVYNADLSKLNVNISFEAEENLKARKKEFASHLHTPT